MYLCRHKKNIARHFDTCADIFWQVLSFSHALYTICMSVVKFSFLSHCDVLCEHLYHLWIVAKVRKIFTQHDADLGNSLRSLQLIQNAADRVLSYPNPTCMVLKYQAASYLEELIVPYHHNSSLFSQNAGLLVVPRISSSIKGVWALSCQASCCWTGSLLRCRRLTRSLL